MPLQKKTALITGASRGLGLHIASSFVKEGIGSLIIIARDKTRLAESADALNALKLSTSQKIMALSCDISNANEVETLSKFCNDQFEAIDILVNNASCFGPIGHFNAVNFNDWLETINTNYIGTARLIKFLLPLIRKSNRGKIINIVGGGASKPYGCLSGYATSKVAVVRFTEELAYELVKDNIDINSLAPGPLNTRFVEKMLAAGPEVLGQILYDAIVNIKISGGTPFDLPAALCCFLADSKSDGISGKMMSARYDDWEEFALKRKLIANSDIYTLRRVES